MNISIIGTGYVGLVTGVGLAAIGHKVTCVDIDSDKVAAINSGKSPIYEKGLEALLKKALKQKLFEATGDMKAAVEKSHVTFIAVPTPNKKDNSIDLSYIKEVSKQIGLALKEKHGYHVVAVKSTVVPKTTLETVLPLLQMHSNKSAGREFDLCMNPEFLREGVAVADFLQPDRIVIGVQNKKAEKVMREIYRPIQSPVISTSIESAEIIKQACNAFLATKISFINAVADVCENNGGNIDEVAAAMGLDKRIGTGFLMPGLGFGGSCLPKDLSIFMGVKGGNGYHYGLLKEVDNINRRQRKNFVKKIEQKLSTLEDKKIAVLGLSFKPDTDDMRHAPSIDVIDALIGRGAAVKAYDPAAIKNARLIFGDNIAYADSMYAAADQCDAMVILTDWKEFSGMNLSKMKQLLKKPVIIDGRNMFEPKKMLQLGFDYYSIGRTPTHPWYNA